MRLSRAIAGAAGLVVAAACVVWLAKSPLVSAKSTADTPQPPAIPVTAGTATARNVPVYVEGLGSVQAFNLVTVKTRVDGQITKVFFKEGQEVKAGDPLFQIDPRPFENALQQAQATKEKDEAQLKAAQLDLERFRQLLPQGFQTRQSFDQQQATVAQLQASIKADQAQIDMANLNLDYALIRSPIAGRTGQRSVDIGNYVQASQGTALVTIAQVKPIYVSFSVPAKELDAIRRNQAAHPLKVLAYGMDDKTPLTDGTLTLIDNQVDAATGTIHLKAQFANDKEPLWPGEFVNARLVLSTRPDAVTVPARTVMQGPNGPYVYVLEHDGTRDVARRRSITVTATQGGIAVIGKGVAAGTRVVVDGQYRLTDGSPVKIAAAADAALGKQAAR